jgi:hypothetical protein
LNAIVKHIFFGCVSRGVARDLGNFGKIAMRVGVFMKDRMDFQNDEERLVAEQALLNYRELKRVRLRSGPTPA